MSTQHQRSNFGEGQDKLTLRGPIGSDGPAMQKVARASKVLSVHDTYYYALMANHFQRTCIIAECGKTVCGYVTGYIPPAQPDTLFIWQVGVAPGYQGKSIGKRMLSALLYTLRPTFLEATIVPANRASIALFRSVAVLFNANHTFSENPFLSREDLGPYEPAEHMMRIGPLSFSGTDTSTRIDQISKSCRNDE